MNGCAGVGISTRWREDDLEDVAGRDVLAGRLDHLAVDQRISVDVATLFDARLDRFGSNRQRRHRLAELAYQAIDTARRRGIGRLDIGMQVEVEVRDDLDRTADIVEDQQRVDEEEVRVRVAQTGSLRQSDSRLERPYRLVRQVANRAADKPRQMYARNRLRLIAAKRAFEERERVGHLPV